MKYIAEDTQGNTFDGHSVQDVHDKARAMNTGIVRITKVAPGGKTWTIENKDVHESDRQ